MCAESACGDRRSGRAAARGRDEVLVEAPPQLRIRGRAEARPVALAGLGGQRELRYDEQCPAAVEHAAIHSAGRVVEDAVAEDALEQPIRLGLAIGRFDTEQHYETRPDGANDSAIDVDGGLRDALQQSDHAHILNGPSSATIAMYRPGVHGFHTHRKGQMQK